MYLHPLSFSQNDFLLKLHQAQFLFQKYSSQSYPLLLFYLGVINVNIFRFILFVICLSFSIYLLFAILFSTCLFVYVKFKVSL